MSAGLREAVEALAWEFAHFDITVDEVPTWVDVPDDYEGGVNSTASPLRAALAAHPAPDPAAVEAVVARVLEKHGALGYDDCDGCECGADVRSHADHQAHVAAAVAEALEVEG